MIKKLSSCIATVNLSNCHKIKNITSPFILVLGTGENIFTALSHCATEVNLPSASVSALGAIVDVKMGYYREHIKKHETKIFNGTYEIVSLVGNITSLHAKPFIHLHAGISGEDFLVVGGHLIDAYSGPVSEFIIYPFKSVIHRAFDHDLKIDTICHKECAHENA